MPSIHFTELLQPRNRLRMISGVQRSGENLGATASYGGALPVGPHDLSLAYCLRL